MKIGIIREQKTPPDTRVALTPAQCKAIMDQYKEVEIVVAPSPNRCYTDQEYIEAGIQIQDDLNDCEVLLGVKEVPIKALVSDKTYFFFSHTIKEQSYNRKLLQAILAKNIRLIDYEVLTNANKKRLIAFGVFAGMVGAHNGLMTYGERTKAFQLPRMNSFFDYKEATEFYKTLEFPPIKIVLTGTGRVASGAAKVLKDMGIRQVSPSDFLEQSFEEIVFTQLSSQDYVKHKDGKDFDKKEFYQNPKDFVSAFEPYTRVSDLMINGIYWDNDAPAFFTKEDMRSPNFKIQVIADVTCDIAPVSSIPSTLKASTIADPIFGYNAITGEETAPHQNGVIDMMTIDNLPNELPRDASESFGNQFIEHIIEPLLADQHDIIERGTVAVDGQLGKHFLYLTDYVNQA